MFFRELFNNETFRLIKLETTPYFIIYNNNFHLNYAASKLIHLLLNETRSYLFYLLPGRLLRPSVMTDFFFAKEL